MALFEQLINVQIKIIYEGNMLHYICCVGILVSTVIGLLMCVVLL